MKKFFLAFGLFATVASVPQSALAAAISPEILKLRQEAIDRTFDAIQLLATQRRAAAQITYSTPRFSPEWEAAKADYRALSRQIFFLQRKWIQARFERRRGVLLYYVDYATNFISPT